MHTKTREYTDGRNVWQCREIMTKNEKKQTFIGTKKVFMKNFTLYNRLNDPCINLIDRVTSTFIHFQQKFNKN